MLIFLILILGVTLGAIVNNIFGSKKITNIENKNQLAILAKDGQIKDVQFKLYEAENERNYYHAVAVNLQLQADSISKALEISKAETAKVKGSLKKFTNSELVTIANKEYGGSDTTKLEILLSRPTTEFLIESAITVKSLHKQLDLALVLNSNYVSQLDNDKQIFKTYDKSIILLKEENQLVNEKFQISEKNFERYIKKTKREKLATKIVIGVIAGAAVYGFTK